MKILFLHGWQSVPGGVKPTYLKDHGHEVINPKLPDENFAEAVRIAQADFDRHRPQVVVGSSRGGAVAMNINSGEAKLVLLCPAWKKWGTAKTVKPGTVILHSRADDVVPFTYSEELTKNSEATLIEVGTDHRLADPEPLAAMLKACEGESGQSYSGGKGTNAVEFLSSDHQNMIATLARDAITCHEKLKNEPQSATFWRRTMVKSVFAFHEGLCSILRDIARKRQQDGEFTLDKGEIDVLDDTEFELENTGKVGTRTRKDKTLSLIAFTIRVILKGFGVSDDDISRRVFGIQGWNDLRTSMAVRDRLTHPKSADSLLVTDDEIEKCRSSMGWMYQCIDLATRANLRQAGVPEDRIQEVSNRILAALPDVAF